MHRTLSPGQRLITEELATRMGVSRTPVREALRKLELEGLIHNEPWHGMVVAASPPLDEMEEFYALRGALEGLVAFFAARRRPTDELAGLRAVMGEMSAAVAAGDVEQFINLQVHYYDQYIGLARSRRLYQMASSIRDYLEWAKPVSLSRINRLSDAFEELNAVVEAIEAGDAPGAEALAREHCRKAYQSFRSVMAERVLSTPREETK